MMGVIDRCVLVTRTTQLQELLERFTTVEQTKFYMESAGEDFASVLQRHTVYDESVMRITKAIPRGMKFVKLDRAFLPQFEFRPDDVVLAVGQDGLVSNTAKYLSGQALLGINPDPAYYEGVLLPWTTLSFGAALAALTGGHAKSQSVTLAVARTNDGRELLAFNDLFIGQTGHSSALYEIAYGSKREFQSSSGIIVSTGAGATGWMRSIQSNALKLAATKGTPFPNLSRESEALVFAVREAWPSKTTAANLVFGQIDPGKHLTVHSRMGKGGVIFSDGIEWDNLEFNAGRQVQISAAKQKTRLVVP
ncbi:MAG: hypothetical protein M3O03_11540 [Pseudomonadota bacterium]|nr:hypothetical protein [Pseudomonadota bacterium]